MPYYLKQIRNNQFLKVIDIILRGYSQVVFQDNPLTGLLFLLGVFVSSYQADLPQVAIGSLVGTIIATLCGFLTRDQDGLDHGMYGYNGCLVGAALPTFLVNCTALWAWVVLGSILSVLLTIILSKLLRHWNIAVFTAPFVFSTWVMLVASHHFGHFRYIITPLSAGGHGFIYIFRATIHGVSQIFLCNSLIGGSLLLLGLLIASVRTTLIVFSAALISVYVAVIQGDDPQQIAAGLYAFSAILTGVALGRVFYRPGWCTIIYTFVGIVLTVLLQRIANQFLGLFHLPALTMPFVIICWISLLIRPVHAIPKDEPEVNASL